MLNQICIKYMREGYMIKKTLSEFLDVVRYHTKKMYETLKNNMEEKDCSVDVLGARIVRVLII